jgi:hypothetical protein
MLNKNIMKIEMDRLDKVVYTFIFLVCCFVFLPFILFGDNSVVTVHDYLDQNLPQFKMFRDNGLFFKFDAPTKGYGEMSTLYYMYVGFNFHSLLYYIFDDFIAYALNYYFSILLGWFSMYLLLKKYVRLPHSLMLLVSLCYAILPVIPIWNIATASLPLIIFIFFALEENKRFSYKTLLLLWYPFFSNFPSIGIFILGFWFIGIIATLIKNRKLNFNLLVGFFALVIGYILVDLRMFYVMFILKTTLNRSIFSRHPDDLVSMLKTFFLEFKNYGGNGHYHAASMQRMVIIPSAFFVSLGCVISRGRLSTKMKPARPRMDTVKLLFCSEFLLVIFAAIAGLYASGLLDRFIQRYFSILSGFDWGRVYIFNRVLWYFVFALCLSIILEVRSFSFAFIRWKPHFSLVLATLLICSQTVYTLCVPTTYNDQIKTWFNEIAIKTGVAKKMFPQKEFNSFISYKEFFAEDLFSTIKKDIAYSDEKVVAVGYHPSVLMYNGFNCIDGYNNAYPLSYMQKFRTLIAPELEINKAARDYYDSWGGRMYLYYGGTLGGWDPVRNINQTSVELHIDMDVFQNDFDGTYILSRIKIATADDLGLNFVNQYNDERSIYTIYLYKTME